MKRHGWMRHAAIGGATLAAAFMMARPQAQVAAAPAGGMAAGAVADYHWRNIGPASVGGRITDVVARDSDFRHVVVAAASGGVWQSFNAGTTWTPIFEHYGTSSIGDVAMFQPNPDILWVGTGESNNRNSVAWGDGIYKSTDAGRTFSNAGLKDTFQIARVVTHPADPNIVYVAAVGNLWGYTGQRGVFKTTDGGATWQKLGGGLPDDGMTGATDLVIDPRQPDTLIAAFYQRLRRPWRFDSGGENGGLFKTTDGGRTWKKLGNGLPAGATGRIGLDIYRKNPDIVMAIIEAGFQPNCGGRGGADPDCDDMTRLGSGVYRSEDGGETWTFVNRYNNRPFYYSQIRINPSDDQRVYVLTTSFRWSTDGGKTITQAQAPFGSNYDHHAMWIDPDNPDVFYLGKDKGLTLTYDHGESFVFYDNLPIAQFYHVTYDSRDPYAIYGGLQDNGSFGTMSFTRDVLGIRNDAAWKVHWDDGQYMAVDPNDWRTVYSEGTVGSFRVIDPIGRTDTSRRALPTNITNFQAATGVAPDAPDARGVLRFNWSTPFILSPHDPGVLYYGTQHVLRTHDKGETWTIISPDLSKNDPAKNQDGTGGLTPDSTGAESYATIYSLSESPVIEGLIWAGTDDGNVWLTRDAGANWAEVGATIPEVPHASWVSRIVASAADANTAYVAFDNHRSDDRRPWLFQTTDAGRTWTKLSNGLPADQPVYVVVEDDRNPNLLFVGTEGGVHVSLDRGATWTPMTNGLPTVAVHDLQIQPRDRDVIAGTHGRGLYVLDDISALEQWTPAIGTAPVHVFTQQPATLWADMSRSGPMGDNTWAGENPPDVGPVSFQQRDRTHLVNTPVITFSMGPEAGGMATLAITAPDGRSRDIAVPAKPGITRFAWTGGLSSGGGGRGGGRGGGGGGPLLPGTYQLRLTIGSSAASGTLMIREDPIANQR